MFKQDTIVLLKEKHLTDKFIKLNSALNKFINGEAELEWKDGYGAKISVDWWFKEMISRKDCQFFWILNLIQTLLLLKRIPLSHSFPDGARKQNRLLEYLEKLLKTKFNIIDLEETKKKLMSKKKTGPLAFYEDFQAFLKQIERNSSIKNRAPNSYCVPFELMVYGDGFNTIVTFKNYGSLNTYI